MIFALAHRRHAARHAGRPRCSRCCASRASRSCCCSPRSRRCTSSRCRWRSASCSAPTSAAACSASCRRCAATPEARRVTLGNFLFKLIGCIVAIPLVGHLEDWIGGLGLDEAREVVLFHLFFNVMLALLLLGFTEKIAAVGGAPAARAAGQRRSVQAAAPRSFGAGNADAGDLLRRARSAAHRRRHRADALRHAHRADDQRSRARRSGCASSTTWWTSSTPRSSSTSRRSRASRSTRRKVAAGPTSSRSPSTWSRSATSSSACITDLEDKKIDKGRKFSDAGMAEIVRPAHPPHREPPARAVGVPEPRPQERAGAARAEGAVPRPRARVRQTRTSRAWPATRVDSIETSLAAPRPHLATCGASIRTSARSPTRSSRKPACSRARASKRPRTWFRRPPSPPRATPSGRANRGRRASRPRPEHGSVRLRHLHRVRPQGWPRVRG